MGKLGKSYAVIVVLVFLLAPLHESVTVSPALCPTNKIAPHRRAQAAARTFAAYYDLLLGPNAPHTPAQTQSQLQEQSQPDQPDDCGEIEDYDENDLSSLSQGFIRRNGRDTDSRFLFGGLFQRPQTLPSYNPTTQRPSQVTSAFPTRPTRPTYFPQRPGPYWSGGYFSQNQYQTPPYQEPSDNYKPVHEAADISEVAQTYRPGLVGGPLNHVVGLSQARPTPSTPSSDEKNRRRLEYLNNLRRTAQPMRYTTARPRKLSSDQSVVGSFVDLFFK